MPLIISVKPDHLINNNMDPLLLFGMKPTKVSLVRTMSRISLLSIFSLASLSFQSVSKVPASWVHVALPDSHLIFSSHLFR